MTCADTTLHNEMVSTDLWWENVGNNYFLICIKLQAHIRIVHLERLILHLDLPIKLWKRLNSFGGNSEETENNQLPQTHPAEMQSHSWSHSATHGTEFPSIHGQPVLVGWRSIEVVFELGWKGDLGLITVEATPLLITARKKKGKANIKQNLHNCVLKLVKPATLPCPGWGKLPYLHRALQHSPASLNSALG